MRLSFADPTNHCHFNQLVCQILTRTAYLGKTRRSIEEYTDVCRIKNSFVPLSPKAVSLPSLQPQVASGFALTERLPNEGRLQPTTHPGTRSVIHISHELILTLIYETPGKKRAQAVTVRKAIGLASCRCLSEALLLPPYAATDQKRVVGRQCMCQIPTAQMIRESALASNWTTRGLETEPRVATKK